MLLHLVPVLSLLSVLSVAPPPAPPTAPPTVRLSAVRLWAGLGGAAASECTVRGWPLPAVRWLRQGVPVQAGAGVRLARSATSNTTITLALHLTNLTSQTAGRYTCAAVSRAGVAAASTTVILTTPSLLQRHTWEFWFLVLLSSVLLFFCLLAGTRTLYLRWGLFCGPRNPFHVRKMSEKATEQKYDCEVTLR